MAEKHTQEQRFRLVPLPRKREGVVTPDKFHSDDELEYDEVEGYSISGATGYSSQDSHNTLPTKHYQQPLETEETYETVSFQSQPSSQEEEYSIYCDSTFETDRRSEDENKSVLKKAETNDGKSSNHTYVDLDYARREVRNAHDYLYGNEYLTIVANAIQKRIMHFKTRPKVFINTFETTHDEMRSDEETFIIVNLLKKCDSNPPQAILDGNLDQLAMLACCSSPHVVKRALDVLLNEIFLSISDFSKVRCRNILQAEQILRASFLQFMDVDHFKAKSHRMIAYAWLVTLVLLKCSKEDFKEIQEELKEFDRVLDSLQNDKEHCGQNTFRYGTYLARESIKQIIQTRGKKDLKESLCQRIKKCEKFLNGTLAKEEVMKLCRAIRDGGSWLDFHVCLVFLQDLPKFHQFQGNPKPIILIQMMIEDFRERCSASRLKSILKIHSFEWQFEILVYHLFRRLIRTSKDKAIIEQVLNGEQGCGGVLRSWIQNKSASTKDDQFVLTNLEKLCARAVFVATPSSFKQFITNNCKGDEKRLIENLSIRQLSATYREKVLEILQETRARMGETRVSTYDALMSGKKCLLKLHQHSKEELLNAFALRTVPLRKEIEIVQVLNAEQCPNIVRHFGSSTEAPMHMIVERTPKGDLLKYLQSLATLETPPEAEVLLQIALDVCNAMIHLGKKSIIHCDLRAKNCFVFLQEGKLLTKLGDFHLARLSHSLNRQHSSSSIKNFSDQYALRWMAVEAIQSRKFDTASDVWSFGILMSEVFTFGGKPYVNMPSGRSLEHDKDVEEYVLNGDRLELHLDIPETIQELIKSTMLDTDKRPSFVSLKDKLMDIKLDDVYASPAMFKYSYGNYVSEFTQLTTTDDKDLYE